MVMVSKVRFYAQGKLDQPPLLLSARNFDKSMHKNGTCLCADPLCTAVMVHVKDHLQHFIDDEGEAYRVKIPAHYRRRPSSPSHHPACAIARSYFGYADAMRTYGGQSKADHFVFNLNIPTDRTPAPERKPRTTVYKGPRPNESMARVAGYKREKRSEGVNSIQKLSKLLEETAFDPAARASVHLRAGPQMVTLGQMYFDDPLSLYRHAHACEKGREKKIPVAMLFEPIAIPRKNNHEFWSRTDLTVSGLVKSASTNSGEKFDVNIKITFLDSDLYKKFTQDIRAGKRSFLIYAERYDVHLEDMIVAKQKLMRGQKPSLLHTNVHVGHADQILEWKPPSPQYGFERLGLELPVQTRPAAPSL